MENNFENMDLSKQMKILSICSIVFGIVNLVGIIGEGKWYKIMCFALLGGYPIVMALLKRKSEKAKTLRSLAWVNIILGLAILAMASGTFYAADHLPFLNYISAAGLILSGLYFLLYVVRHAKVSVVD